MEAKITEKQRTLYERVPEQLQANMQEAFQLASEESGTGMKQRMVETLSRHAREVSDVMFDDARDALLQGVRSLNNWLCTEFDKMTAAVKRNASLAAENLVSGEGISTESTVKQQQQLLDELESLLAEFACSKENA